MIQIDFFDKDVLDTLVPIHTMSPDKIYFLTDKRNATDKQVAHAIRAIQRWNSSIQIICKDVNVDDIRDVAAKLEEIRQETPGEDICVDLTGGTELMSVCGYEFCKKYNARLIYMDSKKEYIIDVLQSERLCPIKHICLDDYITAIGAKRLEDSHDMPTPEEYDRICGMAEVMFENTNAWHALNDMLAKQYKETDGYMEAYIPKAFYRPECKHERRLMKAFEEFGFWNKTGKNTYRYASQRYQDYMINYGLWLEMYIYIKARDVFEETGLGMVLDWTGQDVKETQDNEIDVIVMRKSTPIFISCKMCKPEAPEVYEVSCLANRFGLGRAKACLATTYPVRKYGSGPKGIFQRFKKMQVGVIEVEDFKKKEPHVIFNKAIQMTE